MVALFGYERADSATHESLGAYVLRGTQEGGAMRSAYDGIYFDLKRDIEEGVYAYRDLLPSESVLVKKYGCAHNTVRKALEILARDGYVQAIHGKGVRVIFTPIASEDRPFYELSGVESLYKTGIRHGFVAKTKVLLMETILADADLAALTHFDEGEKLVHLERVRFYDGRPYERETNYFRADTVQGMTIADAERSVYDYIELVRKGKLVTSKRHITLVPVDERDREILELGDTTHLAQFRSMTYDGEGLLCEWSVARNHPEIFSVYQIAQRTRVNHA